MFGDMPLPAKFFIALVIILAITVGPRWEQGPFPAKFFIALVIILALIGGVVWLVRRSRDWEQPQGLRAYMIRVHSYMAMGVALTGALAWITFQFSVVTNEAGAIG